MVVHIVMFKFKKENKESNIKEVVKKLHALVELAPDLKSMETGVNFTESERAFDFSIYATFETKENLDAYAIDSEHLKVVEFIRSVTVESKIVDYTI